MMSADDMTKTRVEELILIYGANSDLWPEEEREAAEAVLAAEPARFEAVLAEAGGVDDLLGALKPIDPSPALMDALISDIPAHRAPRRSPLAGLAAALLPQGRIWPVAGAMASLVVGFIVGLTALTPEADTTVSEDEIVYVALGLYDYGSPFEELN